MRERMEPVLKLVSLGLLALLLVQGAALLRRMTPLKRSAIPEVPAWPPRSPGAGATNVGVAGATAALANPPGPPPGMPPGMMPGMPPGMMPGGRGGPPVALAPEAQARIDRVVQSEILGMVMRPPPMALLGIAGKDVFLRAPNGMSGLVREGGEFGGVQLLRIGTNRVLVREGGAEKELTIFDGIGGESLLSTPKKPTP